jgi:tetratricopeptide (TPR) repeat protein
LPTFTRKQSEIAVCIFLIYAIFVVYFQVQGFGFINYDDPAYITENGYVRSGLTLQGAVWAFSEFHSGNWHPLTWMSHMLDVQLFGLNPRGHHLVNVLFHLLNSLLLFYVLRNLTGSLWRAAFVATLFALHPIHVESVAWISERKDVLSTFFGLLTLLFYSAYVKQPSTTTYLLVFASLALGLMSKSMLVTLPFVLLLLDFWPLSRPGSDFLATGINSASIKSGWPLVREKIPLFILVILSCVVTIYAQKHAGAIRSIDQLDAVSRIGNAIYSYCLYIVKMFLPLDLALHYPLQNKLPWFKIVGSALVLTGIFIVALRQRKKFPYLLTGWLWYVGTMVPVIGLIQVGNQAMADRYTYIPLIGLFIMISWGVADLLAKISRRKMWGIALSLLLVPALMAMSRTQVGYWKNSVTLFEHSLSATSNNSTAHFNLGNALKVRGKTEQAIEHYQSALQIDPASVITHNNLGRTLYDQGDVQAAIEHYQQAIQINPDFAEAYYNLGIALLRVGQLKMSIANLQRALEINPDHIRARQELERALAMLTKEDTL